MDLQRLKDPFPPSDVKWRPGATNRDKTQALALGYIDARAVMDRLDEVASPENWVDEYRAGPLGGVICRLSIRINDEWIAKEDGADNTQVEPVKGGISDALRRAAVKWGIGRYLYDLPNQWVACESFGNSVRLSAIPKLPPWAIPERAQLDRETGELTDQVSGNRTPEVPPLAGPSLAELLKRNNLKVPDLAAVLIGDLSPEHAGATIDAWMTSMPGRTPATLVQAVLDQREASAAAALAVAVNPAFDPDRPQPSNWEQAEEARTRLDIKPQPIAQYMGRQYKAENVEAWCNEHDRSGRELVEIARDATRQMAGAR